MKLLEFEKPQIHWCSHNKIISNLKAHIRTRLASKSHATIEFQIYKERHIILVSITKTLYREFLIGLILYALSRENHKICYMYSSHNFDISIIEFTSLATDKPTVVWHTLLVSLITFQNCSYPNLVQWSNQYSWSNQSSKSGNFYWCKNQF